MGTKSLPKVSLPRPMRHSRPLMVPNSPYLTGSTLGSKSLYVTWGVLRYVAKRPQKTQGTHEHKDPYAMVWYGMIWYGMVWSGLVWYGLVWSGLVWYGMIYSSMVYHNVVEYGMV